MQQSKHQSKNTGVCKAVMGRSGKVCLEGGRDNAADCARWMRRIGLSNRVVREHLLACRLAYAARYITRGTLPERGRFIDVSVLSRYGELAKSFAVLRQYDQRTHARTQMFKK